MKTQNVNLAFNKSTLVELNKQQLQEVNGGLTPTVVGTTSLVLLAATQLIQK